MLTRAPVLQTLDRPCHPLRIERVRADDVAAGQLLDHGNERVGLVDRPDLADPDQPRVGLELDEDEIAPRRADDRGPDVRDLHGAS